jgi:metal-dependent amidase/aminoacylase/carboxypeptidase family protein
MMVHPADHDLPTMTTLAIHGLEVDYEGSPRTPPRRPQEGRNALDAAVLGYVNVAALRQHIRPDERVHGIFTDGGEANIVPRHAAMEWYVRRHDRTPARRSRRACVECLRGRCDAAAGAP